MEEKTPLTILLPNSFRETASTIHIDRARDSDGGVSVDTLGRMLQRHTRLTFLQMMLNNFCTRHLCISSIQHISMLISGY